VCVLHADFFCALTAASQHRVVTAARAARYHTLHAIIDGAMTPPRARRSLLRALAAHFADVIDGRIGARCWAAADPYLKVRRRRRRFDPTDADPIFFFSLSI